MSIDHLVTHQLLSIGALTIIDIYLIQGMANVRIKGGLRGQSRLPGCRMDCWAAHVSIALTVSQTKYIRIHSCILSILIMMIRVQNVYE